MKRLIILALLLALLLPLVPVAPVLHAQDCDATVYINELLEDVALADEAMGSFATSSAANAVSAYRQISQLRQKYEDKAQIPECARVLHSLIVQWFGAAQDSVAWVLASYANPNSARQYIPFAEETNARLTALAVAATTEIERLQASAQTITPPTTDFYRVYFTQPINSRNQADHTGAFIEQALIFVIDNARQSIDGALFELNAPDTTAAFVRALGRGVRVRLVVDDEHALNKPDSTLDQLIAAGAEIKSDERSALMHHKFLVIDSTDVWTGSTNFTRNDIYNNNNNALLIRSPELAANYQAEFEEMFTDRAFSRSANPRTTPNKVFALNGTSIETYFSPEDGRAIESRLAELTNAAQESVYVMAFSFTLSSLGRALVSRAEAGVTVEAVFETTGSLQGQMPVLGCAGIPVRQDGNPNVLHHKVFIFDEQIVALGSFNFSNSARDSNSENMLIIHNPEIAARFLAEFRARFAEGRLPSNLRC